MAEKFDVCVIGSGPGGYVTAIRASQLGFKTAIVEKRHLGGVCLNIGCIPTKALLRSAQVFEDIANAGDYGVKVEDYSADFEGMIKRSRGVADKMNKGVQYLMKTYDIEVFKGMGVFESKEKVKVIDENDKVQDQVEAENFIIATGAHPIELPDMAIDNDNIIGYERAMKVDEQPESMIVMGAGAIGVEFAYFYNTIGTEVTIVEMKDRLVPVEDEDVSKELGKIFKKKGINIKTSSTVDSVEKNDDGVTVTVKSGDETETLEADVMLSAVGVTGNIDGLNLDEIGVEHNNRAIEINKDTYQTNVKNIYAIGDVAGGPWLAHKASHEGINCIEKLAGKDTLPINYNNIPGCTYCEPQIASVGYTEKEAKEEGYDIMVGKFPYSASGKATSLGHEEGFVKVIFDEKYGEWLGCHMIGSHVTELIAEVVVARDLETTGHEIISAVHPHPTMSEAVMEAVAEAYGEGVHLGS
jgi:dihydrolipoamide dehydrogenase